MTTPVRAPWSLRRTTTIDMTWPDGPRGRLLLMGRGRDLATRDNSEAGMLVAEQSTRVVVSPERTVAEISARGVGDALLGAPAMSGFRRRLATVDTAHVAPGTLLYQLLDDLPGATIVSDFARRMWSVYEEIDPDGSPRNPRRVLGLCTGFTPGSSGLNPDGSSTGFHHTTAVATLPRSDDELSWHDFDEPSVMSMRRARRTDVWIEAGEITVDAMFQDSCTAPLGGRAAIHQYTVRATADLATQQITFLDATPGNLPYDECPLAVRNVGRLVGSPLAELRGAVAGELKGTAGCTHLNDALRSLADVPVLLRELDECRAG